MTLFTQIGSTVSFIIITMLGGVMFINYQTTKEDMLQNIYQSSVNNIGSLAQRVSQTQGEEADISTIIDAAFDSGYYKRIAYAAHEGNFSYAQEDKESFDGVPEWFVSFADLQTPQLRESVNVGWQTIGEVMLQGDLTLVYKSLYETFVKLLYLFVGATVVSLILLSLLLAFLLRPLKEVQLQAEAILRDEFLFLDKVPYTTEFKEVVGGMNLMVHKVEQIFTKANETLKRNQELLYVDQITGLYNRRYLLLKLPDLLSLENRASGGSVFFMALKGAELLNQHLGREATDSFFATLGEILTEIARSFEQGLAVRMNGTEFTLVLPDCEAQESVVLAQRLHIAFEGVLVKNAIEIEGITFDIGIYRYRQNANISELLIRADSALAHAKADEQSNLYIYEERDEANAMGKEQWREVIESAIGSEHIALKFWPVVESKTHKIAHSVMTFTLEDAERQYFYGDFIAPAINLGLVSRIYGVALERLFRSDSFGAQTKLCSVRLSSEFVKDPFAFELLGALLKRDAKELAFKLAFEMSDNLVVRHPLLVERFIALFRVYGCSFGINSFSGESDDFAYLKNFNPSFIKADVSFLLDQSKESMSALGVVVDSLGIKLIATSVETKEQLDALLAVGVLSVQGPVTDILID